MTFSKLKLEDVSVVVLAWISGGRTIFPIAARPGHLYKSYSQPISVTGPACGRRVRGIKVRVVAIFQDRPARTVI